MSDIPDSSVTNYTNLSRSFRIANQDAKPGVPLSPAQLGAMDLAISMSPNNANNYPSWALDQYAQQKNISRSTLPKGTDFVPSSTSSRNALPAVTNPPSNYDSQTKKNTDAVKKEIKNIQKPENNEDNKVIQNKSKALNQELPKLDVQKTKQLAFSGDVAKLKDCMVFVLYSPSSNENPNLSNSPVKINEMTGKGITSAVAQTGKFLNIPTGFQSFDKIKSDALTKIQQMADTKEISSNEVERLNSTFYTDESDSKTDKKLTIFLPLPKQITDQHAHEMDSFSNNPIQLAAGLVVTGLNMIAGEGGAGSDGGTAKVIAPGLGQYLMNNLQLAGRKTFNPATETLYRTPSLRNWQWTFEYSPTSKQEADDFILLVNRFKEHSYPTQDLGGILYTFPGTVDFHFRINGEESKVLPRSLQKCFIKGVQIDYTQSGAYAHFKDGNPVTIVLTLDIAETRLLSRSDLENSRRMTDEEILHLENQYAEIDQLLQNYDEKK